MSSQGQPPSPRFPEEGERDGHGTCPFPHENPREGKEEPHTWVQSDFSGATGECRAPSEKQPDPSSEMCRTRVGERSPAGRSQESPFLVRSPPSLQACPSRSSRHGASSRPAPPSALPARPRAPPTCSPARGSPRRPAGRRAQPRAPGPLPRGARSVRAAAPGGTLGRAGPGLGGCSGRTAGLTGLPRREGRAPGPPPRAHLLADLARRGHLADELLRGAGLRLGLAVGRLLRRRRRRRLRRTRLRGTRRRRHAAGPARAQRAGAGPGPGPSRAGGRGPEGRGLDRCLQLRPSAPPAGRARSRRWRPCRASLRPHRWCQNHRF